MPHDVHAIAEPYIFAESDFDSISLSTCLFISLSISADISVCLTV